VQAVELGLDQFSNAVGCRRPARRGRALALEARQDLLDGLPHGDLPDLPLTGPLSALYLGGAKVDIIQSGRYPFEKRHTYALPLEQAEHAIHMLAAHGKGVNLVHLAVVPGAPKVNV
jgi:hypothetical protein